MNHQRPAETNLLALVTRDDDGWRVEFGPTSAASLSMSTEQIEVTKGGSFISEPDQRRTFMPGLTEITVEAQLSDVQRLASTDVIRALRLASDEIQRQDYEHYKTCKACQKRTEDEPA